MTKDAAWELIKNDEHPMDEVIAMIQLDAYKAGMTMASKIVHDERIIGCGTSIPIWNSAIAKAQTQVLVARDNLKETPNE